MVLIFLVILGGRLIRYQLLVDPQGAWKQELWLDSLLPQQASAAAEKPPPKPVLTSPLPINTCSLDSLTLLPRVGPVLAERIAAAREQGMVFRVARDLELVKGIGPSLSARLAPLVVFASETLTSAVEDSLPEQEAEPANSR